MVLHCPFCHSSEVDRLSAIDEQQKPVVLLMFDCPFFIRMEPSLFESETGAQDFLDQWRLGEGEKWLEHIGPILRKREVRNIRRYASDTRRNRKDPR